MRRVLLVVDHLAPYRDDTFKRLVTKYSYELKILLVGGNQTHPEWNYIQNNFDIEIVSKGKKYGELGIVYDKYKELLKSYAPDVVILSGNFAQMIYTRIFYRKCKIIFMSDQIKDGKRAKNKIIHKFLSILYSIPDGIWTTGCAGTMYFKGYTGKSQKIGQGCYTNDVGRILTNYKKYNRVVEREKYDIAPDDKVFLFVGKLIPSRQVGRILEVASRKEICESNIKFLIVGDGEELYKVQEYRECNVISIPSISIQELEKVYAMADAYIYLGWEPYSLALYEAAILGLPIIANSEIGAVKDCVKDHKSGYLVYDYSPNKVAQMIFNVVNGEINEGAFEMSKYIIDRRGVEWATDQLYALIR